MISVKRATISFLISIPIYSLFAFLVFLGDWNFTIWDAIHLVSYASVITFVIGLFFNIWRVLQFWSHFDF